MSTTDDPLALEHLAEMPADRTVPIGCVGAGFIMADCHLAAYRAAGFQPRAICSRTLANAQRVAERYGLEVFADVEQLVASGTVAVLDIAVPPDQQLEVIRRVARAPGTVRGILAQKPLASDYRQAAEAVAVCREAGITLAVNQNMRYDHSVRACRTLLERGWLGTPVLGTIDMRAIPHWMPWQQRQGWLTLRIMSIHHLDTFRYWFGTPRRVFASVRPDPRTAFPHEDGICLYILEYDQGTRASAWDDVWTGPAREGAEPAIGIQWRVEGTLGTAQGTIGWPKYPERCPSTLEYTCTRFPGQWWRPSWPEAWFPDAFAGTMAQLLCALERDREPAISGHDNLLTMALVEACYRSAAQHRAVEIEEITASLPA